MNPGRLSACTVRAGGVWKANLLPSSTMLFSGCSMRQWLRKESMLDPLQIELNPELEDSI